MSTCPVGGQEPLKGDCESSWKVEAEPEGTRHCRLGHTPGREAASFLEEESVVHGHLVAALYLALHGGVRRAAYGPLSSSTLRANDTAQRFG